MSAEMVEEWEKATKSKKLPEKVKKRKKKKNS